jgi:hypothetical protein
MNVVRFLPRCPTGVLQPTNVAGRRDTGYGQQLAANSLWPLTDAASETRRSREQSAVGYRPASRPFDTTRPILHNSHVDPEVRPALTATKMQEADAEQARVR